MSYVSEKLADLKDEAIDLWEFDKFLAILGVFVALVVIGLCVIIPVAIVESGKQSAAFKAHCEEIGGTTRTLTDVGTGVGVGTNGQPVPVTTTSSTTLCLSSDGRILDVQE